MQLSVGRLHVRDVCIGTNTSRLEIPSELSLLLSADLYLETSLLKSIANKVFIFFFLFLWFCFGFALSV